MNAHTTFPPVLQRAEDRKRPSALTALATSAARIAMWPARVIEARRTLSQLAGLSEHELRDVGLTRQDLVDLTARPLDEDPTPYLARARGGRARRRA